MKKLLFALLFIAVSGYIFAENLPAFMVETNVGYAVGVNLNNAMQIDTRLYYSFERFGFAIEAGSLFTTDYSVFHLFLGPMYYFINNEKWRLPIILGFDFMKNETDYLGAGAVIALHYRFTKYFYTGVNLGITYAFDNIYDEITGYKTEAYTYIDGSGNPQLGKRNVPVMESKHHYGNNFYFKPSLVIGLQF